MKRSLNPKKFFTEEENKILVEAIKKAEKETSGEIRVHLDNYCFGNPYKKAVSIFNKIGMYKTASRNGILIYLSVSSKKFALIGDKGIHEKVPDNYWDQTTEKMQNFFIRGEFVEGLKAGILEAGARLKEFFPYKGPEDINELSDEISVAPDK